MVDKEMIMNFEHKTFGEKLIAPGSFDFSVVFFWLPKKENLLESRL